MPLILEDSVREFVWEVQCSACGQWHHRDATWSLGGQFAGQPADHPTTGFPCITPGNHVGTIAGSRKAHMAWVSTRRRAELTDEQVWAQIWTARGETFVIAEMDPGFYGPGVIEALVRRPNGDVDNYRAGTIAEAIDGLLPDGVSVWD